MPIKFNVDNSVTNTKASLLPAQAREQLRRVNNVINTIHNKFPELEQRIDTEILFSSDKSREETKFGGGGYNTETNKIVINPDNYNVNPNPEEFLHTVLHELYHAENAHRDKSRIYDLSPDSTTAINVEKTREDKVDPFHAQDAEETLADLLSTLGMQDKGLKISDRQQIELQKAINVEGAKTWLDNNKMPSVPVLQSFEPSIIDNIKSFVSSIIVK